MELFLDTFLVLHIITGSVSLIAGTLSMIFKKGSPKHILSGRFFFWGMTGVFVTALTLSIFKSLVFLFFIAIFSYYMALSGEQALRFKRKKSKRRIDFALHIVAAASSIGLLIYGFYALSVNPDNQLWILCFVFGGIGASGGIQNTIYLFRRNHAPNFWVRRHIAGMIGGYIATLTAFCVTAVQISPALIAWLGPTVLFVPVIIYWQRKAQKKRLIPDRGI